MIKELSGICTDFGAGIFFLDYLASEGRAAPTFLRSVGLRSGVQADDPAGRFPRRRSWIDDAPYAQINRQTWRKKYLVWIEGDERGFAVRET
jgi:hypothetical protein